MLPRHLKVSPILAAHQVTFAPLLRCAHDAIDERAEAGWVPTRHRAMADRSDETLRTSLKILLGNFEDASTACL